MIPVNDQYPDAKVVEWAYNNSNPSFYRGLNNPKAIVLHVMEGYASTAVQWANQGYASASWHFTVTRTGEVYQHLRLSDGGYHAGIPYGNTPPPTWKLWRGYGENVNHYTVGIEHEGFTGTVYPIAQIEASIKLTNWLCDRLNIPRDRDHIIGHYEIDPRNRPNDPGPTFPWDWYMSELNGDEDMSKIEELEAIIASQQLDIDTLKRGIIYEKDANGNLVDYSPLQMIRNLSKNVQAHFDNHPGPNTVADHTHEGGNVKR